MNSSQLNASPPKLLFGYLHSKKSAFYLPSLSSIANKVFDLMPPILVAWVIDAINNQPPQWLTTLIPSTIDSAWNSVFWLSILTILIFLGESVFQWGYEYGFQRLAQNTQHDLRMQAYNHLQQKKLSFFENNRTGNLMSIINDDINQLERFLNDGFNQIIQLLTLFVFAGITLFMTAPLLASVGLIPIPLIFICSIVYQRMIAPHYKQIRKSVGMLGSRLENNISGIVVIKSFTAEDYEKKRVEEASNEYRMSNFKAIALSSLYVPFIRTFIAIGFVCVLLIGGYQLINGTSTLTMGGFAMFAMMIQRLLWPVTRFGTIFNDYERAMASVKRVFELINSSEDKEIENTTATPTSFFSNNSIRFENVSFSYQAHQPILKNICLEASQSTTIGIVGATGAGKTTLIKLLLRLYDTNEGIIRIGNTPIHEINYKQLRQQITLVSQDVYLFHGSIYENLTYGGEYSYEQVIEKTKMVGMHDFIMDLPQQYDAMVGERGIKLSGGQRQRLSIVRALLKNAPIMLFDEATSAIDVETEAYIQQHLNLFTQNKTTLIVAHRLSTIRHCDKIVVMEKGSIAEEGTHEELLQLNGVYAGLWNIQQGELAQIII